MAIDPETLTLAESTARQRACGPAPMERIGALPATSRIAQTIEHNRGLRKRLIADIAVAGEGAGLTGGELAALVQHMTGERSCSELTLQQLRRVVVELRTNAVCAPPAPPDKSDAHLGAVERAS